MSASGALMASGSADRVVRVFYVDSGKIIATLEGHTGAVEVGFSMFLTLLMHSMDSALISAWTASF